MFCCYGNKLSMILVPTLYKPSYAQQDTNLGPTLFTPF